MKKLLYASIALIFVLISCNQRSKEINELKFGVMSSMDYVPLAVAKEMGFFEKQGVKVDIQKFYSANDRDAAFQTGNIDGTIIDYTGAILQKAGGVDLKITSACNSTFCLMTGTNGNIRQVSDLRNKKVAVSRNTVIDFCVEMALQSVQLSAADVEKQEINKIPIRLEMLMQGKTDATALPDPFITIASAQGARSIVCMEDLGYAVTGIMFAAAVIDRKEAAVRAFYQAYNDAVAYILAHPENIKTILVKDVGFPEKSLPAVKLPEYTPAQMP
ncbi:MAG: ABC transporter substrate-binding protein, partial [Dysgonamonadaceae bacterium]|nr:ABC transporter substrate-binding protein [Dysgonamonadaceae bacterium]